MPKTQADNGTYKERFKNIVHTCIGQPPQANIYKNKLQWAVKREQEKKIVKLHRYLNKNGTKNHTKSFESDEFYFFYVYLFIDVTNHVHVPRDTTVFPFAALPFSSENQLSSRFSHPQPFRTRYL